MNRVKAALLLLLLVLILIQFIQPARNKSVQGPETDVARVLAVPERVQGILKNSCYDCHSNNTRYPWYASLQPGGWWLASHIKDGKEELNFNEFGNYSRRRQQSKLKAIAGSIKDGTMPLPSYLLIHRKAKLSLAEKELVLNWTGKMIDSLSQKK